MKKNVLIISIVVIVFLTAVIGLKLVKEDKPNEIGGEESVINDVETEDVFREEYAMLNIIGESPSKYLQPTFTVNEASDLPLQNGLVYPNFTSQERINLTLNGEWDKKRFESDYKFTLEPRSVEWIQSAEAEMDEGFLQGEPLLGWDVKTLPGAENELKDVESVAGVEPYEGGVYYRRTIEVGSDFEDKQLYLKAMAVNYVCDIWVNGKWVGWHEGGYTPFVLDITDSVNVGEVNTICLRIDNPPWGKRLDIIPAVAGTDFFNYTGMIQAMSIEGLGEVMVSRNEVITEQIEGKTADIKNRIILTKHDEQVSDCILVTTIYEADKEKYTESPSIKNIINTEKKVYEMEQSVDLSKAAKSEESIHSNYSIDQVISLEDIALWDVYTPNLYVMEIQILNQNGELIDSHYTQFGIRTIETKGKKIMVNGSNVFLRGIARHEEWPGFGRTATWERIRSDFDQMMSLDVNFIRTGHYPNHLDTYVYLDRIGILSMSEIPLWQLESSHFKALDEKGLDLQMFREMVFSQFNSPSIILWSTQNECKGISVRTAYNEKLVTDLRTYYDDGRLITQSAAADQGGPKDASMEPLDVNGWTMYFGIFHGSTAYNGTVSFLESVAAYWDKPSINTEFGVWSGETDHDATVQNRHYKQTYDALMSYATIYPNGYMNPDGALAGIDYWIMYNWYVNHNQWIDTFGIYHMDRTEMKPVGESIRMDYAFLKEVDDNNDSLLEQEVINLQGEQIATGNRIDVPISFESISDIDQYNYLDIAFSLEETRPMVHLILEDNEGNQFDYYTDKIIKNELTSIKIPLYRIKTINLENIRQITFSFSNEEKLTLEAVNLW